MLSGGFGFGPAFCFALVVLCFCLCCCLLALENDLWRRRKANGELRMELPVRNVATVGGQRAKEPRWKCRTKKAGSMWAVRYTYISAVSGLVENGGPHGQISFISSSLLITKQPRIRRDRNVGCVLSVRLSACPLVRPSVRLSVRLWKPHLMCENKFPQWIGQSTGTHPEEKHWRKKKSENNLKVFELILTLTAGK